MTSLAEAADAYVAGRRRNGELGAGTAKTLRSQLTVFVRCCPEGLEVGDLDRGHIAAWLASIGELRPGTRRGYLSGVRGFIAWALDEELLQRDPTRRVGKIREPRRLPRALTAGQLSRLTLVLPNPEARLVVALMCPQGLRCVEVARLTVADWDPAGEWLRIRGKGGYEREIPVADTVAALLHAWLAGRSSGPIVARTPHWLSRNVSIWMDRAGIKTGGRDGISAHALRHTAASDLYERTGDLRVVQAFLGHTNVATTDRYLRSGNLRIMREGLNRIGTRHA